MADRADGEFTLKGVRARRKGRHAFVHERVLELVARETKRHGSVAFRKANLAARLGCCPRSLDRAVTRLRREGYLESRAVFDENGSQQGNVYQATEAGIELYETALRPRQ